MRVLRPIAAATFLGCCLVASPADASLTAAADAPAYAVGAPGDADCSGDLSIADALTVVRRAANLGLPPECGGDASGDGGIGPNDALIILQYLAGLPVPPRLTLVAPSTVPQGSGPVTVRIEGGLFYPLTALQWDNQSYALSLLDSGTLAEVTIPASRFAAAGVASLRLQSGGLLSPETHFVTITPPVCSPAQGISASLHVVKAPPPGLPEVATIWLSKEQNMTGWQLRSLGDDDTPDQVYTFPAGYYFQEGQQHVEVHSGVPVFADSQQVLWWRQGAVWANSSIDNGDLRDCNGVLVARWDDPGN